MNRTSVLAGLLFSLSVSQGLSAADRPTAIIFIDVQGLRSTEIGRAMLEISELQLASDTYDRFKARTRIEPTHDINSISNIVYDEYERITTIRGGWERDLLRRYLEREFEQSTAGVGGSVIYTRESDCLSVALPEDGLAFAGDEESVADALRGRYDSDIRRAESLQGAQVWMIKHWSGQEPVSRSLRIADPALLELRATCGSDCDPADRQTLYEVGTDEILEEFFPLLLNLLPERLEETPEDLRIQAALEHGFAVVRIEFPVAAIRAEVSKMKAN